MLLKLGDDKNKWTGGIIGLKVVREMVTAYQKTPAADKKDFKYAHFNVKEIIDLFIANKILPEGSSSNPDIKKFGFKIYMGNHHILDNCPFRTNPNGSLERDTDYVKYNSPVLCNTIIVDEKNHKYKDMLTNEDTVSVIAKIDGGYGVDQSVLCPPDCAVGKLCSEEESTPENFCEYDVTKKPLTNTLSKQ